MSLTAARASAVRQEEWLAWPLRPFRAWTGSPLWLGAAAIGLYAALAGLWYLTTGFRWEVQWVRKGPAGDPLYALTLAYVPVALLYIRRGTERDLGQLAGVLNRDIGALRRLVFAPSARALLVGVLVGLLMFVFDMWFILVAQGLSFPPALVAWFSTRELLCDLLVFWVVAWLVTVAARVSRLAPEPSQVRLLATDELAVFVQHGVRLALFWLLLWAIWAPAVFLVEDNVLLPTLATLGVWATLSGLALWLPTRAVRRAIRAAKQSELGRVRSAIEAAREEALRAGPSEAVPAAARLPGLLAYEQRVADVSEWLLDARALGRVGFYLLIPLAGWIGGALVERGVDALLG